MKRNELRFLISQRVPSLRSPGFRTETFASQRNEPSCMLPSQMPIQRTSACSALRVRDRLLRAAQVGLGHDLEQRRAGAVEIDAGHAVEIFVQRLARVFLEVRAREADCLFSPRHRRTRASPPCTIGISYWLIW